MKLTPPPGFVLIKLLDKFIKLHSGNLWSPTWKADDKYLIGRVVGVGASTYGYDNKYYYTGEVNEGDWVYFNPLNSVVYQLLVEPAEGNIIEIYKVPINDVVAVIENFNFNEPETQ